MEAIRMNKTGRRRWAPLALLLLLALIAALGVLAEPAEAARPPIGRTYYTTAMGLERGHDIKSHCFEFHQDKLCSVDGLVCGSWEPTEGIKREMGLSFDLTMIAEGDLARLEGLARLDTRGKKSSLAGTGSLGPAEGEGKGANFSFAAREVGKAECLDLLEAAADDGDDAVIVGSGNVATEDREVSDFHGLLASGVGLIEIRHGDTESLRITADDNILPILTAEVRGGRLVLGSEGRFSTNNNVLFEVTVRDFDNLTVAGVLGVDITGLDNERFDVDISGVSAVTVAGTVDRQKVTMAGVSRYDARELSSRTVEIDVTGPSYAAVRASNTLRGSVVGGATLEYIGNPTVDVTVSVGSTLRKIG
jgi:hypothetical protein